MGVPSLRRRVRVVLAAVLAVVLAAAALVWFVVIPRRVDRALAAARAAQRAPAEVPVVRAAARPLGAPRPAGVTVLTAITEARDGVAAFGRLWVASGGGLLVFDPAGRHVETLTHLDGLPSADTTAIARWGRYVAVGGEDGSLVLIDGDTLAALHFQVGRAAAISALAADGERLLVATLGAGLIAWDGRRATRVVLADGAALPDAITALAVDDAGRLAVGAADGRVFVSRARAGALAPFGPDAEAAAQLGRVTALVWRGEDLLVGRPFGLDRLDPGGRAHRVQADVFVTALLSDPATDHLYIGTFDAGVLRGGERGEPPVRPAAPGPIHALRLVDGRPLAFGAGGVVDVPRRRAALAWPASPLPGAHVTALAVRGGEIWAGTFEHGLARLDAAGRVLGPLETPAAYGVTQINAALVRAEAGDVWLSTARGALVVDAAARQRRVLPADGLVGDQVADLAAFSGRLAFATNRGLTVIDEASGRARSLGATFGLPNAHATAVRFDAEGRLFVGTLGGLAIVSPELVVEHQVVAGPDALGAAWVTALLPAPGGMLVGTYGGGVALVAADGRVDAIDGPWRARPVRVNPGAIARRGEQALVGTLEDGVLVVDLATHRVTALPVALGTRNVTALLVTTDALWIGTDKGLVRVAAEVLA